MNVKGGIMQCKRCQCDVDGLPNSEQDAGDALCSRCSQTCELCGLGLYRPLTANQIGAALSIPLTLPRPTEPQLRPIVGSYRLCISCRSLQDTRFQQQQATLGIASLVLDGSDQEVGAKLRSVLLHCIDLVPDEEIGCFVRVCAQGDVIKVAKAASELVNRLKQA